MTKRHKLANDAEPSRLKANLGEAIKVVRAQTVSSSPAPYRIAVHDADGELEGFNHYDHRGEPKISRATAKGSL